jgi:nucleoside-diphosphate-sugar epimerase
MKILLTGATGYLGLNVARRAALQGAEVHALLRSGSDPARLLRAAPATTLGILDGSSGAVAAAVVAIRPDVTIHLAADARASCQGADIAAHLDANITFGVQLCEALAGLGGGRLINAGSYWEYGSGGGYDPNTLYAAAKRAFQDILVYFGRRRGLDSATLVLFDVYGPGDWRPKMLPELVRNAVAGRSFGLTAGEQVMDMLHVEDAAAGFLAAADHVVPNGGHTVYALMGRQRYTLRETVAMIGEELGSPPQVTFGAKNYPPHQIFAPVSALPVLPGWTPQIELRTGLRQMIEESRRLA